MQPRVAGLRVVLCALDPVLARAYAQVAQDLGDWVSGGQADVLGIEADAVVSPANSFGFMDGGLDALYVEHFGRGVQDAARAAVLYRHDGELLVGDADLVPTSDRQLPYVVLAPTMRVPMRLPPDTVNPYLAMRAVLRLVERGVVADGPDAGRPVRDVVRTVAVPGLGTGVGRVPAATCARQVRRALEAACGPISLPRSWADASHDHQTLFTDAPGRLQPWNG